MAGDDQYPAPHRIRRPDDGHAHCHLSLKDARDAALKTGMKEGMDPSFARLEELLRKLK